MKILPILFATLLPIAVTAQDLKWPPTLPDGKAVDSGTSPNDAHVPDHRTYIPPQNSTLYVATALFSRWDFPV